ncbi:MAG TPA: GntR family transcriptional regulator [Clostridia bacterium]|nr:GntR family transcriptional regulator [Clostridia bacterium]
MKPLLDESKPIYLQIAERIEDEILNGTLAEGEQVYSTNEFARMLQINPATAAKGINLLVEEGKLFKKRGIGMFVAKGAREIILAQRKERFVRETITALFQEAAKLGISKEELLQLIRGYEGGRN